ncbi:hypothetical protein WDZ92_09035, partial [Nostoc sp. NIES-2111]
MKLIDMLELIKRFFLGKWSNKADIYNLSEVFTPSSAAVLTFVERPSIDYQIKKALSIVGNQLIIYGHSGGGKTTITQNILMESGIKSISTNCTSETTIESLFLDCFDQLNKFYVTETANTNQTRISAEIKSTFSLISSAISADITTSGVEKKSRILPVQLTAQRLAEFLGAAEAVWVV